MTPFEQAVTHTLGIEGGYSDHPSDRGGKTNWGITEGVARAAGYAGSMAQLPKGRALDIYRRLYWDRIGLDWIASVEPLVAFECFDTGVNMGVSLPIRWLQRILNALNRQAKDYPDILVDGVAGKGTADALRAYLRARGAIGRDVLLEYQNALQGARYIDLADGRPANEDFVFGWGRTRLEITDHGPLVRIAA